MSVITIVLKGKVIKYIRMKFTILHYKMKQRYQVSRLDIEKLAKRYNL